MTDWIAGIVVFAFLICLAMLTAWIASDDDDPEDDPGFEE